MLNNLKLGKMKLQVEITGDTNDGDLVCEITEIDEKDIPLLKEMKNAIDAFEEYTGKSKSGSERRHSHNFPIGECLRCDLGELSAEAYYLDSGKVSEAAFNLFENIVPYGEYGLHSITSIEVKRVEEVKL
jgi:hypothetical protein